MAGRSSTCASIIKGVAALHPVEHLDQVVSPYQRQDEAEDANILEEVVSKAWGSEDNFQDNVASCSNCRIKVWCHACVLMCTCGLGVGWE